MSSEHVGSVARAHLASLTGLLSELGLPAAQAYYTGCVRTRAAVGFVAVEDGAVRGFVLGSAHPGRLKQEVFRRNRMATVAALARGIVTRPSSLLWLLRSVRGPDEGTYNRQTAELTYLAVDVARRDAGVGRSLVEAFTRAMRESGVTSYELSVDEDNQGSIRFYEAQGFHRIGRYREFGRIHYRYRLDRT